MLWAVLLTKCEEFDHERWRGLAMAVGGLLPDQARGVPKKGQDGRRGASANPDRNRRVSRTCLSGQEVAHLLCISGANVNDATLLKATLESVVVERPEPRRTQHLCLDKG